MSRQDNPFYHNYVFDKFDLSRCSLSWRDRLRVLCRPTYTQVSDGYVFHYKVTGDGMIYLMKMEPV